MMGFIEGEDRGQGTLLPELLDDYVAEDNPVRVVDVFVNELGLALLGFTRCNQQRQAGRLTIPPCFSSSTSMATLSASNRAVGSSSQRNVERMSLTQRSAPDFRTIANSRKDNGKVAFPHRYGHFR
jgi:transposase